MADMVTLETYRQMESKKDKQIADLEKMLSEQYPDLKQSLDWANERERELLAQIEKMKNCLNCDHYRWSNGDDWCNDHYGQPMYDEECKDKWELKE